MSVTNLTGYTWRPNDSLTGLPSSSITYNINYKLSKDVGLGNASYALMYVTSTSVKVAVSPSSSVVVYDGSAWTNKPKYFYFTGGTDAINGDLIAWLETNGTLSDRHNNLGNLLTDIADGIRDAYGVSGSINAQNFPEQLNCGKGAIASNITTSDTITDVPLVSTEGLIGVKYMSALTVPSTKTLTTLTNNGTIGSSSYSGSNTGDIYINHGTSGSGSVYVKPYNGTGTKVINNGSLVTSTWDGRAQGTTLKSTITPSTSEQYVKCDNAGWSNVGDYIKINAINLEAKTVATATVGTAITPSSGYDGMSSVTLQNGPLTVPSGKTYSVENSGTFYLTNNSGTGTVSIFSNSGTVSTLLNSGTIATLNNNGTISTLSGTGTISSATGDHIITMVGTGPTAGNLYVGNTHASSSSKLYFGGTTSTDALGFYAATQGPATALYINSGKTLAFFSNSGTIGTSYGFVNNSGATVDKLTNNGTTTILNNIGTIGDSTSSSSSTTGQNGLYGQGTVYVSATGISSPTMTSTYALKSLVLKGGTSTYRGAYMYSLTMNAYSTIATLTMNSFTTMNTLTVGTNTTIETLNNSGTIGSYSYTGTNTGNIYVNHDTAYGNLHAKEYGDSTGYTLVTSGKFTCLPYRQSGTRTHGTSTNPQSRVYIWAKPSKASICSFFNNYTADNYKTVSISAASTVYLGAGYCDSNSDSIIVTFKNNTAHGAFAASDTLYLYSCTSASSSTTSYPISYTVKAACKFVSFYLTYSSAQTWAYKVIEYR